MREPLQLILVGFEYRKPCFIGGGAVRVSNICLGQLQIAEG